MVQYSQDELSGVIGQIYDCAVDPTLWLPTLTGIRDRMDLAYVQTHFMDRHYAVPGHTPEIVIFQTKWSEEWNRRLQAWLHKIPNLHKWFEADIDEPLSQFQIASEEEFKASEFYEAWVAPQDLCDFCNMTLIKRSQIDLGLSAATHNTHGMVDDELRQIFRLLAPHVRRSFLIGGMLDEGKLQLQLYRQLLDRIGAGVMIVAQDCRLVYANEMADALLSDGLTLTVRQNKVTTSSPPHAKGLKDALDRACTETDTAIGNFGNGIPLTGTDGSVAVCYVLPLGKSERRRELGPGLAAIFVTTNGANVPPALEVLSALSGMTSREARIALMIADGQSPNEAASALGISVHTLRTHLARIFEKTGVNSQRELAKFVGGLSLPMTAIASKAE